MRYVVSFIACFGMSVAVLAQERIADFKWSDLASPPTGSTIVTLDGRDALKIENTNDGPMQVTLLNIEHPKISRQMYEISGEIRYDNVKGDGFLEMWNIFPPARRGLPEGQYFSRTLGDSGDMGKISGTSDWRRFSLPFDSTGAPTGPSRLKINLVLQGRGTVYIGLPALSQYTGAGEIKSPNAWWSDRQAGLIGGSAGALFGALGAIMGTLSSFGKCRRLVIAFLKILIGIGVVCLAAGVVALSLHQPYGVFYPLLLLGVLLTAICGGMLPMMGKRYREFELRRMQSMDVA